MSKLNKDHLLLAVKLAPTSRLPTRIADIIFDLAEMSEKLHRLAEHECNRELTAREKANQHVLETKVKLCAKELGAEHVEINGDPRGAAVKLRFPKEWNIGGNDFGDPTLWCV